MEEVVDENVKQFQQEESYLQKPTNERKLMYKDKAIQIPTKPWDEKSTNKHSMLTIATKTCITQ